jgi:phage tail sheath gpL-like
MASPIQTFKVYGKTAGSTLSYPLGSGLTNVAIANAFRRIGDFFQSIGIGTRSGNIVSMANGAQATGAVTFSSIAAADTVTVNGTVFTGTNGTPSGNQFKTGVTDTASATSLAAAVNASATAIVANNVSATSSGAIITFTAKEQGTMGNLMTLAISAHGSVSTAVAGGTDGTVTALAKGI